MLVRPHSRVFKGEVTRAGREQKDLALHTGLPSPQLCSFPFTALLHKTDKTKDVLG